MTNGIDELSDKEKEALRLLFAGHDAKSSARELDLSFHTINDRLRNARRKLGVSSSREAARLLAEAEDATPQSVAHTQFGVAGPANHTEDEDIAAEERGDTPRPVWQHKGVLIMSVSLAVLAMVTVFSPFGHDATETDSQTFTNVAESAVDNPPTSTRDNGAEQPAREWLALVDDGGAEASFAAAGAALRDRHSEAMWELGVALRNNNWGVPLRRTLTDTEIRSGDESGAMGEFAILTFDSEFTKRPQVTEQLTMQNVGGEWVVVDYTGDDGTDD